MSAELEPEALSVPPEVVAERDAEIVELRRALTTVREGIRNGHAAGLLLGVIKTALDGEPFVNSRGRYRLRRAKRRCGKVAYLARQDAEQAVADMRERYGTVQRPYLCPACWTWHLTSKLRAADREAAS